MSYSINDTTVIDSNRNVIIGSGSSRPASPPTGTLWFNTTTNVLEGWNGSSWVVLSE